MESRPGDHVSCLGSQGKKLRWDYREVTQLMRLCDVSDEGRIRIAVFVSRLRDDVSLIFIRTLGCGTFAESQFMIPMNRIFHSNAFTNLGKGRYDTLVIFKMNGEMPTMLGVDDLPAEIRAMII